MKRKLNKRYMEKYVVGLALCLSLLLSTPFSSVTSAKGRPYKPSYKRSIRTPKPKVRLRPFDKRPESIYFGTESVFRRDSARLSKKDVGRLKKTGKEYVAYKSFYLTGLNEGTNWTVESLKQIPVEKKKILILPLVTDSKTNENIDIYFGDQKISVNRWERENLKKELGKYSQMFIFALGHLENNRFVKRTPGNDVEFSISLDDLFEFGKDNIVFPLGCKSAMYTGGGGVITEFNTSDAVLELHNACSKARSYEDLFAELSSPSMRLVIDASMILAKRKLMRMNAFGLADISLKDQTLLNDILVRNKNIFNETGLLDTPEVKIARSNYSKESTAIFKSERVYIPPSLEQITKTVTINSFEQYHTDVSASVNTNDLSDYTNYKQGDDDDSSYGWLWLIPGIIILLLLPSGGKKDSMPDFSNELYKYNFNKKLPRIRK